MNSCTILSTYVHQPTETYFDEVFRSTSSVLPDELLQKIFELFTLDDLASASLTCRRWAAIAQDEKLWNLRRFIPDLKQFTLEDWKIHFGLSIEDQCSLTRGEKRQLLSFLQVVTAPKVVESDAGVMVLTMPKGYCLEQLEQLASASGHSLSLAYNDIEDQHRKKNVEKTHTVVITNRIISGSRLKMTHEHHKLLSQIGSTIPDMLTATALLLVQRKLECFDWNEKEITYTRTGDTIEQNGNKVSLVVGNSLKGIFVGFGEASTTTVDVCGCYKIN
ncbi:MAG: F-box protein [Chlamydiales bacterium]|nr:F-box protein [Chlamydiia bacterium]MCP5507347.1 F-box protein [Chlamydiales bacterium]